MRRVLLAATILLTVAGCEPTVSSSPTPPPTPTQDVRLRAADAFLAAVTALDAQTTQTDSLCATASTPGPLRTCWMQRAAAQKAFIQAIDAIKFPDDLKADAKVLMVANDRLEAVEARLAALADPSQDLADRNIYGSATSDVLSTIILLRGELGILPPSATTLP
jgi:hypothetical protein